MGYWAWTTADGIWGIGTSERAARADAARGTGTEPEEYPGRPEPMSRGAYLRIRAHGYDCTSCRSQGVERRDGRWILTR